MQIKEVQKNFSENLYQNYDILNKELNDIYTSVCKSIENNYNGLLFSNTQKSLLKKLNTEEIFVMNIHDKIILAILNISIYNAIVNENHEILYNGIYTYSRLRSLNHLHLTGFDFVSIIESLIFNGVLNYNTINWKKNFEKQFKEKFWRSNEWKIRYRIIGSIQKNSNR